MTTAEIAAIKAMLDAIKVAFNAQVSVTNAANANLNAAIAQGNAPELVVVAAKATAVVNALNAYSPTVAAAIAWINSQVPSDPATPVDCVLSAWSAWSGGNWSTCVNGTQSRTETRTRTVVTQPSGGGAQCGPLTESRDVTQACVVVPPPQPVGTAPWATRIAAPGVFRKLDFTTPDQLGVAAPPTGNVGFHAGSPNNPTLDPTVFGHAGGGSLKFVVPAWSGSSGSGEWYGNFSVDLLKRFGTNSEFFIQWQEKKNNELVNGVIGGAPANPGIKLLILGHQDGPGAGEPPGFGGTIANSSSAQKLVVTTRGPAGKRYVTAYRYGEHFGDDGLVESDGGSNGGSPNIYFQNALKPLCNYSTGEQGCFPWLADQLQVWKLWVKLGAFDDKTYGRKSYALSEMKLWGMNEGAPPSKLIMHWHPGVPGYTPLFCVDGPENQWTYGKLWFGPYMTREYQYFNSSNVAAENSFSPPALVTAVTASRGILIDIRGTFSATVVLQVSSVSGVAGFTDVVGQSWTTPGLRSYSDGLAAGTHRWYRLAVKQGGYVSGTITVLGISRSADTGDHADMIQHITDIIISSQDIVDAVEGSVPAPGKVDCVLSQWSPWTGGAWSVCANNVQSRTETRTRTVITPAANGGAPCGALSETRVETQPCGIVVPPGPIAWRPPEGYFADIPMKNRLEDVFPKIYGDPPSYLNWRQLLVNWTGGTLLRDYSSLGGVVVSGSGHEITPQSPNIQGAFIADLSALNWAYSNAVTAPNATTAADGTCLLNGNGEFLSDGTPYSPHTYQGLQELRTSEGGGPKGSVVYLGGTKYSPDAPPTTPTSHLMDVSKAVGGHSRFSVGISGGMYPVSVKDEKRGGFWLTDDVGAPARLVKNDGTLAATISSQNNSACANPGFVLWPEKDLLIFVGGGYHSGANKGSAATSLFIYDLANNYARSVVPVHGVAPVLGPNYSGAYEADVVSIVSGGSGYKVGDTITLPLGQDGATSACKLVVSAVNFNGAVTAVAFDTRLVTVGYPLEQRGWYLTRPANPIAQAATSGTGTGATFSATWRAARDYHHTWYAGCHWCSLINGIVAYSDQQQKVLTLMPPQGYQVGDVTPWAWAPVPLQHWDAGDVGGAPQLQKGINGAFSKFMTVPSINALVLVMSGQGSTSVRPQVITLPGMG